MPIKDFGLDGIGTRSDLAMALCVAVPALDSVASVSSVALLPIADQPAYSKYLCMLHVGLPRGVV